MSTEYDLKPVLAKVANGEKLNEEQAEQAFDVLMSGQATPSQMGAFLMARRPDRCTVTSGKGQPRGSWRAIFSA